MMHLALPAVILWLNAVVFLLYGLVFALAPEVMSTLVTGSSPSTGSGLTDMRSTYGGMSIGLGLLLGLAARRPANHSLGLLGVVAIMVGMGCTRVLGMLVDGHANAGMYVYLALEVVMAGLALWVFRRLDPSG